MSTQPKALRRFTATANLYAQRYSRQRTEASVLEFITDPAGFRARLRGKVPVATVRRVVNELVQYLREKGEGP